ncbi:MAG: hypothetical protein LBN25_00340 [Christensenellaceae bacterium]|jgi:cell division ATPase FtsA|nr:hypothetical protein [Christensenellaceae bacterium]
MCLFIKKFSAVLDIGSAEIILTIFQEKPKKKVLFARSCEYTGYKNGVFNSENECKACVLKLFSDAKREGFKLAACEVKLKVPAAFCAVACTYVGRTFSEPTAITRAIAAGLLEKDGGYSRDKDFAIINKTPLYYELDAAQNGNKTVKVLRPEGVVASKLTACVSYLLAERWFLVFFNTLAEKVGVLFSFVGEPLGTVFYAVREESEKISPTVVLELGKFESYCAFTRGDGIEDLKSFEIGYGEIIKKLTEFKLTDSYDVAQGLFSRLDFAKADAYDAETLSFAAESVNDIAKYALLLIAKTVDKALKLCTNAEYANAPLIIVTNEVHIKGELCRLIKQVSGREVR